MKNNLLFLFLISSFFCFSQENLITTNHSFSNAMSNWETGAWGDDNFTPEADFNIETKKGQDDLNCIKVYVKKNTISGMGNRIFLKHLGLKVKKGKNYRLSFWVRSFTPADRIHVEVYSAKDTGSNKPWTAAVNTNIPYVGNGKWQKVSKTFTMERIQGGSKLDLKNIGLLFGFDLRKGSFYLDNVMLERI